MTVLEFVKEHNEKERKLQNYEFLCSHIHLKNMNGDTLFYGKLDEFNKLYPNLEVFYWNWEWNFDGRKHFVEFDKYLVLICRLKEDNSAKL